LSEGRLSELLSSGKGSLTGSRTLALLRPSPANVGYVLPAVEELHPDLPVHLEPRAKAAISSVVKPTTLRKHASSSGSTNV
jgi:hypothetical protein